jgi:hypothetical protein
MSKIFAADVVVRLCGLQHLLSKAAVEGERTIKCDESIGRSKHRS